MHIVGPDYNRDEVASFSIRSTVDAIPCPEGAAVVDKDGNQLATYADKCYVVIDGDNRYIVSAYVFDGLYSETSEPKATVTTSEDIAAQHEATAAAAGQPVTPSRDTLVAGLSELDADKRAELRAALDEAEGKTSEGTTAPSSTTDTTTTGSTTSTPASSSTADTTAATPASSGADPSVAALSSTPDAGSSSSGQ